MNQLAKLIGDIATGEARDEDATTPAQARATKGGLARAKKLTSEERAAIARKAAQKRWEKA
jgi:hypothetical protein